MIIEQLTSVDDTFMQALQSLMAQLTPFSPIPTRVQIEQIIAHPATTIWVAKDEYQAIIGMLTLAIYPSPTGTHAWVEDVVINEAMRAKGYGSALTRAAMQFAQEQGAKAISLTSRPGRVAANQLYQKIGFEKIETNMYRFHFPTPKREDQ